MAYVPGYTGDVFISYAHLDNNDNWVTDLKSKIANRLTADLAGEPEIWFDADRLSTGDIFKQEIHDKLNNTLILVAVISPSFLNSDFCRAEELDWYLNNLGRDVFQLAKVPLTKDQQPPLPEAHYEELFDANRAPLRGPQLDAKLDSIIWQIRQKLEAARAECKKVYLAQPKNDLLRSATRSLKTALHQSRLAVLPSEAVTQRTLESKIRKWIEDAVLSIHIQTDPPDPLAEIQHRIAQSAGKPTLVLPGPPRAEDLPDIVQQAHSIIAAARRHGEVYFIYDHHSDLELAHRLRPDIELLGNRKVTLPQPGETYHKAKLAESDGIILFRSSAPQSWYESQKQTLQQATALRNGRVIPEAYYAVAGGFPESLNSHQPTPARWEIHRTGLPDIRDLLPFFNALTGSTAATAGGQS